MSESSNVNSESVVWPLGRRVTTAPAATKPVLDLKGKTVAQLWDYIFKGDEMYRIVRAELESRCPGVKFVDYRIFGDIHSSNEKEMLGRLPQLLRQHGCDAAIVAVGS